MVVWLWCNIVWVWNWFHLWHSYVQYFCDTSVAMRMHPWTTCLSFLFHLFFDPWSISLLKVGHIFPMFQKLSNGLLFGSFHFLIWYCLYCLKILLAFLIWFCQLCLLWIFSSSFHLDGIFTLNWSFIPLPIILFHMHAYTHRHAQLHFSLIYTIFLYCYRVYNHFWMVYLVICHVQLKLIIMPLTNLIRRRR